MLLTGELVERRAGARDRTGQPRGAGGRAGCGGGVARRHDRRESPLVLAIGKEAFYRQAEMDLDAAYRHAAEVMTTNMLARDAAEGIDAFLAKRAPVWEGR